MHYFCGWKQQFRNFEIAIPRYFSRPCSCNVNKVTHIHQHHFSEKRELKDSTIQEVGHSFHALFIVAKQCVTLFTPGLCDSDSDSGSGALWCRVLIKLENSSSRSKRAARRAIQRGKVKTETHKQRQAWRLLVKEEETLEVKADFYLLTNCRRCSVCGHSLDRSQPLFYHSPPCEPLILFFVPRWSLVTKWFGAIHKNMDCNRIGRKAASSWQPSSRGRWKRSAPLLLISTMTELFLS